MTSSKNIVIYTDGACKGNPGRGGWGAILKYGDKTREIFGGEDSTTNNRMELTAAIEALSILKNSCCIDIYTDSKYVQKGISEWIDNWIVKNWKSSANKPVKNKDLWEKLNTVRKNHKIQWHWLKGHNGHSLNERADFLANKGIFEK